MTGFKGRKSGCWINAKLSEYGIKAQSFFKNSFEVFAGQG
jgi:hypothetical protein